MLYSTQNTPEVREALEGAALDPGFFDEHGQFEPTPHFEHGQWWLCCSCGEVFSVVDASPGAVLVDEDDPSTGLDFESVGGCDEDLPCGHYGRD